MKKIYFTFILFIATVNLQAQNEVPSDSLGVRPNLDNIKLIGDFMLDMNILNPPKMPSFHIDMLGPDATKDYSMLFQLPSTWIVSPQYVPNSHSYFGFGSLSSGSYMQSSSFRLNGNMWLNTYGQYDIYGRRIPNHSALPWEKNNFMGGMELKFNKNFGIRIEVQQGRNYPY